MRSSKFPVVMSLILVFVFGSGYAQKGKSEAVVGKISKQQILDALENLKYSENPNKKKEALNFLFDHIKESKAQLYQELVNPQNEDLVLANIFNILSYGVKDPDMDMLFKSARLQMNKSYYMFYLLTYLYKKDMGKTTQILGKMLDSSNNQVVLGAYRIIGKNQIQEMKEKILSLIQKEKSPYIIEKGLFALSDLALETNDLDQVAKYLSSEDQGVRRGGILVLEKYPAYFDTLRGRFEDTDYFFEKNAIIAIMVYYPGAFNFLLQLGIDEGLFRNSILEGFSGVGEADSFMVSGIMKNYESEGDFEVQNFLIQALSQFYGKTSEEDKLKIENFMIKNLKKADEERIRYMLCENLVKMDIKREKIRPLLTEIFREEKSWRVRKIIAQILDLQ